MAKIHTVEWTPGIVNNTALWASMNANWSGVLGQHAKDAFGRLGDSEIFSGIMGSPQEHHGARFQLTEEFISVYRMLPLIPDDWKLYEHSTGRLVQERYFDELQGANTRSFMDGFDIPDLLYSLGIEHPGAITLHNYPRALQRHRRIDGELMDLATMDIIRDRDRERGVPRYNDFREEMRMPRVRSFDELTTNPQWADGRWAGGERDPRFNHLSNGSQYCPAIPLLLLLGKAVLARVLEAHTLTLHEPVLDPGRPLPHMVDFFAIRFGARPRRAGLGGRP